MTATRVHRDKIRQTAERYGIEPAYLDAGGQRRQASTESIIAALRGLGAPVERVEDIPAAYEARREQEWRTLCDPVMIAWNGSGNIEVRASSKVAKQSVNLSLTLEDGELRRASIELPGKKITGAARFTDGTILAWSIPIPWDLPPGYHQIEVSLADRTATSMLISAPEAAFGGNGRRTWGAFLPLYALRSEDNWGAGNYTDLQRFLEWIRGFGGDLAGTLPLLPTFLDEPYDPSPYVPVSRLFWNEFYIDVTAVPEFEISGEARDLVGSPEFQEMLAKLRADELVDYREGMALRRRVLDLMVQALDSHGGERKAAFEQWLSDNPRVVDYARFRAAVERTGTTFHEWPERMRDGTIEDGDFDPAAARYHSYVQWVADQQIAAMAESARQGGAGLYMDLPLGVHSGGYDVWREREAFVTGFTVGAPPDPLNEQGQNWGFPPLHPERLHQTAFRHLIDVLRHHVRYAGTLRLDHVMGLHRQYWVPEGGEPGDGVYVRYPAEHLYAILSLESHRHETVLIGEDLGTVPDYVRPAMTHHGLNRTIVLPFALMRDGESFSDFPGNALLSLNTHDTPPCAAILEEWLEPEHRERLVEQLVEGGWLPEATDETEPLVRATIEMFAASQSRMFMINLEDLWLERRPQNVPGTADDDVPNWRRKAALTFEEFSESPQVTSILRRVNELRQASPSQDDETSGEDASNSS